MNADDFISASIERGAKDGVRALEEKARTVFLVSEAEVLCDMEGIDTLLDHIEKKTLFGVSDAFDAIGASEIGGCLKKIEDSLPLRDDAALKHTNNLITSRTGYSYDTIKQYIEEPNKTTTANDLHTD